MRCGTVSGQKAPSAGALPSFMGGEVVEADLEPQLTGALRVQSPPPGSRLERSREVRVDVPFKERAK